MWLMLHLTVLNLNFFYNSKIDFLFFSYINKSKNAAYNYFFKCHVISFCDNVKKILKKKTNKLRTFASFVHLKLSEISEHISE